MVKLFKDLTNERALCRRRRFYLWFTIQLTAYELQYFLLNSFSKFSKVPNNWPLYMYADKFISKIYGSCLENRVKLRCLEAVRVGRAGDILRKNAEKILKIA